MPLDIAIFDKAKGKEVDLNQIIVDIMVVFMLIGAVDRCLGNRFGLGGKIDEALDTMGPMCVPMVGMLLLAPIIGEVLSPVIAPFFQLLGADPAMFGPSILACDMGGYALATSMAVDPQAGQFAGCILGCSLGGAISFIIPVGIGMIREKYHAHFTIGVLVGIITVPFGMIAGGIAAGYPVPMVLRNTFPIFLFSVVIALGLWKAQRASIRIFGIFGRIISAIATVGFAIGIVQELTPVRLIEDLPSVLDGVKVVGSVAIVLCGAYPMIELLKRAFGPGLEKFGSLLGIDRNAAVGILGGLANIMPILGTCNTMSPAGITVSIAFAVSGSCLLGDHLGYIASVDKSMLLPVLFSKVVGAVTATALAAWICKKQNFSAELER